MEITPNRSYLLPIAADGIIGETRTYNSVSGNVNIGNRIFTEKGVVSILGDGIFKISPAGTAPDIPNEQLKFMKLLGPGMFGKHAVVEEPEISVSAIIDGTAYEGNEILFDKGNVTVQNHFLRKDQHSD